MQYVNAFWVGGLICVAGQILIDKTKLTPARILTGFVVAGVILGAIGLYKPLVDFAGTPTTTEFGGTSFNTTEPAPILELEPTVKDPSTLAPLETTTLSPIVG